MTPVRSSPAVSKATSDDERRDDTQAKDDERRRKGTPSVPSWPSTKDQPLQKPADDSRSVEQSLVLVQSDKERQAEQLKENSEVMAGTLNAITERVNVSSTSLADPILPLELHYLIAQFLSGTDKYRSLANYSLVCRVVRQELRPVLFETVVHERAGVLSSFSREEGGMRPLFNTKYLIVSNTCQWTPSDFPSLVLAITIHRPPSPIPGKRQCHAPRASSIRILKPVNINTLERLLRIPLLQNSEDVGNYGPRCRCVDGIDAITVDALQSVHGVESPHKEPPASPNLGNIDTTFFLSDPKPTPELRETIKHLLGLVVSVASWHSTSEADDDAAVEERKTPRLHFRVKQGGGPVARLVNEICNQPLPGGFWPFVTLDI